MIFLYTGHIPSDLYVIYNVVRLPGGIYSRREHEAKSKMMYLYLWYGGIYLIHRPYYSRHTFSTHKQAALLIVLSDSDPIVPR